VGPALRRIIERYILKEVVLTWLAVTAVLFIILLTNQVARVLAIAAGDQYPRDVVFELIGLTALSNVGVLMPIGLLLGVVLAFGRLYHESEMTAAQACGAGPAQIYGPVVLLAIIVSAMLAWLSLDLAPAASARTFDVRNAALRAGRFAPVTPGKFRTFGGGGVVIYAQDIDAEGMLQRVFIKRSRGDVLEVVLAESARHEISADGMLHTLTLYRGARYEGIPGKAQYRIVRFAEQVIPVQVPELADAPRRVETLPTRQLLASTDLKQRAELHWRLSLPIMALTLTLLGVPLSRLRPRQGRYARVWIAVLIYFLYSNLATAGQAWIERGTVPEWIGLWWVHLAVIALATTVILAPRTRARLAHRG